MKPVQIISIVFAVIVFWIIPVYLGIKTAKKKNISPHWMWIAIHPAFGWLAFIIVSVMKPKKVCSNCGETHKSYAVVCSYCKTPFDDASVPVHNETSGPGNVNIADSEKKKDRLIVPGVVAAIGVITLFVFLLFTGINKAFTSSWAYEYALNTAQNSKEISDSIGKPVIQKGFISGSINITGNRGEADLVIPIEGSSGKGSLSLYAEKSNDEWKMLKLTFYNSETGEVIVLIE